MSRSKEAPSPARSGGAAWVDVSRARKCPMCGHDSWCRVSRDGLTVLCRRNTTGDHATDKRGDDLWIHHEGGERPRPATPAPPRGTPRAPVEALHRGYMVVLERLALDAADREALARRGLSAEDIARAEYRTLPVRGRAELARVVALELGEHLAPGLPGMVWRTDAVELSRGWWSFAGSAGLVIPVRDFDGRVVALKVRRRDPIADDAPRYTYVTSSRHDGPSAVNAVHVPALAREMHNAGHLARLVLTEGELKADVATALLGSPAVSIPGVGSWRAGVDLARGWGAAEVALAFDADTKPGAVLAVARATRGALRELRSAGLRASVWRWDGSIGKGVDDYLAATRAGRGAR